MTYEYTFFNRKIHYLCGVYRNKYNFKRLAVQLHNSFLILKLKIKKTDHMYTQNPIDVQGL